MLTGSFDYINNSLNYINSMKPVVNKYEFEWENDYVPNLYSHLDKKKIKNMRIGGNEVDRVMYNHKNFLDHLFNQIKDSNLINQFEDNFITIYKDKLDLFILKLKSKNEILLSHKTDMQKSYIFDESLKKFREKLISTILPFYEIFNLPKQNFYLFWRFSYQLLMNNLCIINNVLKIGISNKEWKDFTKISEKQLNFVAFQYFCEFNFKFWKLINSKQRQNYLFVTRYKLPLEVKILDEHGLTLGDLTNQATEMIHSIVNSIFANNVKNGLTMQEIAKEIIRHNLTTQILRIERFADKIENSKKNKINPYFQSCSLEKKSKIEIRINKEKIEQAKKIKEIIQEITGKDDLISQKNFELVESTINSGINKGKKIKRNLFNMNLNDNSNSIYYNNNNSLNNVDNVNNNCMNEVENLNNNIINNNTENNEYSYIITENDLFFNLNDVNNDNINDDDNNNIFFELDQIFF